MKNKRLTDQILILNSIACVRNELDVYNKTASDVRVLTDIMDRLTSLYACLNPEQIATKLTESNKRGMNG